MITLLRIRKKIISYLVSSRDLHYSTRGRVFNLGKCIITKLFTQIINAPAQCTFYAERKLARPGFNGRNMFSQLSPVSLFARAYENRNYNPLNAIRTRKITRGWKRIRRGGIIGGLY